MTLKRFASLIISIQIIVFTTGCATTMVKDVNIDPEELRKEREIQRKMAGKHQKVHLAPIKSKAVYRRQIARVASKLVKALKPLCNKGSCNYPLSIVDSDDINASADGNSVKINRGMLRFVKNDNELAVILAHEFSHNLMAHVPKQKGNIIVGSIIDALVSAGLDINTQGTFTDVAAVSYSPAFENEADYVGLYIMARAGYNINQAPYLWRRMSAANPSAIHNHFMNTHPSNPERFVRLKKAKNEIQYKQNHGIELMPEFKSNR